MPAWRNDPVAVRWRAGSSPKRARGLGAGRVAGRRREDEPQPVDRQYDRREPAVSGLLSPPCGLGVRTSTAGGGSPPARSGRPRRTAPGTGTAPDSPEGLQGASVLAETAGSRLDSGHEEARRSRLPVRDFLGNYIYVSAHGGERRKPLLPSRLLDVIPVLALYWRGSENRLQYIDRRIGDLLRHRVLHGTTSGALLLVHSCSICHGIGAARRLYTPKACATGGGGRWSR